MLADFVKHLVQAFLFANVARKKFNGEKSVVTFSPVLVAGGEGVILSKSFVLGLQEVRF